MTGNSSIDNSKKQPKSDDQTGDKFRVTATSLYVREGPGKNYGAIGYFVGNDIVESLGSNTSGKWIQVRRISDGLAGWCSSTYLTRIISTFDPVVPNDKEGEAVIYQKDADPEMPSDLVPTSGNHPLHQIYYNSVFLTHIDNNNKNKPLEKAIDITDETGTLYDKPAEGVIQTMEQAWYLKGVTLGQLSHSLALAPGESTRIAIVDWEQRTRGTSSSTDNQATTQTQSTEQNSAIGEISHALTQELQHGESKAISEGGSTSGGGSGGFSLFGLFSAGGSANRSTNHSLATNVSRSSGVRDMTAASTKKIAARTQQLASSTSSRRATLVKETYESETEMLTTRVVTNYNHMHALSIQYYDVVQAYRVATRPHNYERCLFIPMKVITFTPEIVKKYRAILAAWAPSSISEEETSESYKMDWRRAIEEYEDKVSTWIKTGFVKDFEGPYYNLRLEKIDFLNKGQGRVHLTVQLKDADDNVIDEFKSKDGHYNDTHTVVDFEPGVRLGGVAEIDLITDEPIDTDITQTFIYREGNREFFIRKELSLTTSAEEYKGNLNDNSNTRVFRAVTLRNVISNYDLIDYLNDNALYYSQAIWANADAGMLSRILANYSYPDEYKDREDSKPLGDSLDPVPVAMTGNYLGFRWHFTSDNARNKWLKDNNFEINHNSDDDDPNDLIVSLPSGGVFAEAVLGRFNSAEKLDITRFWNWQDSPIPILPPEVAALQAGSHNGGVIDPTAGQVNAPTVQFSSPPSMPGSTSTGLESILRSISAANIFRDISGTDATSAALQNAAKLAKEGGAESAQQATTAMENAMKHQEEMAKIGLEAAKTYVAPGASLATTSASKVGAALNLAQKLDETNGSSPTASGSGGGENIVSNVVSALRSLFGQR